LMYGSIHVMSLSIVTSTLQRSFQPTERLGEESTLSLSLEINSLYFGTLY